MMTFETAMGKALYVCLSESKVLAIAAFCLQHHEPALCYVCGVVALTAVSSLIFHRFISNFHTICLKASPFRKSNTKKLKNITNLKGIFFDAVFEFLL